MTTPTPTPTPTQTLEQKIIHDLFILGVTAASIFIKNPASQQKAGILIGILQDLIPSL